MVWRPDDNRAPANIGYVAWHRRSTPNASRTNITFIAAERRIVESVDGGEEVERYTIFEKAPE